MQACDTYRWWRRSLITIIVRSSFIDPVWNSSARRRGVEPRLRRAFASQPLTVIVAWPYVGLCVRADVHPRR